MLGLSHMEVWFDYVGLGGDLVPDDLIAFLRGRAAITEHQYDIIVQALNERFVDRNDDHPLAYADELSEPP